MKKGFITDQAITIKIPADPTLPAEVRFTAGPYADEAKRLAKIPGSGWKEGLISCLPEEITVRLVPDGARLIMKTDEPPSGFLVDRRVLTPKPLRKPRPDASKRMSAYNKAKKASAPQE
jgi:hypothetical protein